MMTFQQPILCLNERHTHRNIKHLFIMYKTYTHKSLLKALCSLACIMLLGGTPLLADTLVSQETRVDQVRQSYGLTGEGTIIAILDRGIDYEHMDFRNPDGSSRILYIYDMYNQTGANAPGNIYGVGTIFNEAEINTAITSGVRLATRDAVGHGTATAGIAGGNGRASNGLYQGIAPNAKFIIVKMATEGAPAHGGEPAEAAQPLGDIEKALDFVLDKADEAGLPVVLLANFGSIGGPTDGTSDFARAIDARFGPDKPGRVFVNGTGDDGGNDNHAGGQLTQGQSIDLNFTKGVAGFLRLSLWYSDQDRFDIELIGSGGSLGNFTAPDNSSRDTRTGTNFTYYHNGRDVTFFGATSAKREILIDFSGGTGAYTLRITGTQISDGSFDASLNPSNIFGNSINNAFTSFVEAGHSIWYGATALNNIAPNSYVVRQNWTDIDGISRTFPGNENGFGSLWTGSSIGPTYDGRLGTTISVPGNTNIGAYAVRSYFNTLRFNVIQGGNDPYGTLGAVSGAAPVLTGIISLMLEADSSLDASQVKDILQRTARADNFTGTVPNATWGHGKVDAFAAITEVMNPTSIPEKELTGILQSFQLAPNPFQGQTAISFILEKNYPVDLVVYDLQGRKIDTISRGNHSAGEHRFIWNPKNLAPGMYMLRIEVEGRSINRRIVIE